MASDQIKRKLAAILAADIAGYSRLMGADEAGTLARLKQYRRELIDPKNKQYRGRVVKTTGDGILIEFPSVVDAVSCSIEVQQGMRARNADVRRGKLHSGRGEAAHGAAAAQPADPATRARCGRAASRSPGSPAQDDGSRSPSSIKTQLRADGRYHVETY
jgi:class 3 adenylate cyclase